MFFLEKIKEDTKKHPDKVIIRSTNEIEKITYSKLDDISGRIYNWLKKHNIGKEDMVMICLPRSVRVPICVIGIMKVGAAFVVVENDHPKERIEFIKKDCNCKIVIDEKLYFEMKNEEYLDGYEKIDMHDAFFAVYTSGSTGKPKGVLHEYGKLDFIIKNEFVKFKDILGPSTYAFISSFSFVSFVLIFTSSIYNGKCFFIVENELIKNSIKLCEIYEKNSVTDTFLTPSFVKVMDKLPKTLVNLAIAGESCDGIYKEDINLIIHYASSETGFILTTFQVDKKYDKMPIGKNYNGIEILILDEEGRELPDGEIGEICFKNEYTRGYINLEEKTKEVFVDGIYHMGDMGYKGDDGNYYVCGRKDDMIKINGNRVEPGEIEAVIRREYNIENVIVRGFIEDKKTIIYAYLLESELNNKNIKIDKKNFDNTLKKYLPYYMIPSQIYYLKEIPLTSRGKLDISKLPRVDISENRNEYIEPSNVKEKLICDIFSKVFNCENVGVNDSFLRLGGESISAIKVVSLLYKEGYEITLSELFENPTAKELFKLLRKKGNTILDERKFKFVSDEVFNKISEKVGGKNEVEYILPALYWQEFYIVISNYLKTIFQYKLIVSFITKKIYDEKDFDEKVNLIVKKHPNLRSEFIQDDDKKVYQVIFKNKIIEREYIDYSNNLNGEYNEKTDLFDTQKDFINELIKKEHENDDTKPKIIYIKTSKNTGVFIIKLSHDICDGIGMNVLKKELEEDNLSDTVDNYIELRKQLHKKVMNKEEAILFWKKYFAGAKTKVLPMKCIDIHKPIVVQKILSFDEKETNAIKDFCYKNNVTLASYIQWCYGKTLMDYLKADEIIYTGYFSSRNHNVSDSEKIVAMMVCGVLIYQKKKDTLKEFQKECFEIEKYGYIPQNEIWEACSGRNVVRPVNNGIDCLLFNGYSNNRLFYNDGFYNNIDGDVGNFMEIYDNSLVLRFGIDTVVYDEKIYDYIIEQMRYYIKGGICFF